MIAVLTMQRQVNFVAACLALAAAVDTGRCLTCLPDWAHPFDAAWLRATSLLPSMTH
jgi:hypothetical protein